MKEKQCTQCKKTLPIFKNVTFEGERLHLCQQCAKQFNQANSSKKATKVTVPIKKFSDVRSKRNAIYLVAIRVFLMETKNQFCPVMSKVYGKTIPTGEVHHRNGRENERLTNREFWLAVSREGHQYIHGHMDIAREQGWVTNDFKSE